MTANLWTTLELNYDLFSYVDLKTMSTVFDSYKEYMGVKINLGIREKYEFKPNKDWIDEYGCIPFYMPKTSDDGEILIDEASITTERYNEEASARINHFYDEVKEKTNHAPLYSFGVINYDALTEEERSKPSIENYTNYVTNALKSATVIDTLNDNLLTSSHFYETNYHLNTDSGIVYTKQLINNMKRVLK